MNRSASPSLRGYSYQFHKSILLVLGLPNDDDSVTIENIEDVDVNSAAGVNAVQVKYLESKKLIPSSVKEPISKMLADFCKRLGKKELSRYTLFAHFGNDSGNDDFIGKASFIKECCDAVTDDKNSDVQTVDSLTVEAFFKRFSLEIGGKYDDLVQETKARIGEVLDATADEVEAFYYPCAQNLIFELATRRADIDRVVSKADFLSEISQKRYLYGIWKRIEEGKDTYIKDIRKKLKTSFRPNQNRLLYVAPNRMKIEGGYGTFNLLKDIASLYGLTDKREDRQPITLVFDTTPEDLLDLKGLLVDKAILFNDGYEEIKFSTECFNIHPVKNIKDNQKNIIMRASYELRVCGANTFIEHSPNIDKYDSAVIVAKSIPSGMDKTTTFHITGIETFSDLLEILK